MATYSEYFDTLDFELNQTKEGGDRASNDKFRILPSTQATRYINEAIRKLVSLCPDRFEEEYIYTFLADSETFTVPETFQRLIALWDGTDNNWYIPSDSSDLEDGIIYSPSHNTLHNPDGWLTDDTLKMKVILYPAMPADNTADITALSDVVLFPAEYMDLLTLEIKRRSYARKGRKIDQTEWIEYQTRIARWQIDHSKITQKSYIAFQGHSFGRRR